MLVCKQTWLAIRMGRSMQNCTSLFRNQQEKIDFDKVLYHADMGNVATPVYVAFLIKDRLENNQLTLEKG
ncbi:hypothetical protein [Pedobacter jejuensis]|uniref:Uncharacterized protein n=1 Tax=Pedobacter jejuensis TaxID=1268550 RepID=A0A3N0BNL0_9SPHI|nr:hypothetical protein [Pedobacter jejuensis]RNL50322.1 hypothetical protein D7004_19200 [Pedobacter jejuensis]